MPLVFQYGSNCTASRINGPKRLNGDAQDRGRAQTIEDFDIIFDTFSQTNACAASDLVHCPGRQAWGVLYQISDEGFEKLRLIEGANYDPKPIRVMNETGEEVEATTFLVKPDERRAGLATGAMYVSWIIYGLRAHGVPEDYITHVVAVAVQTNERGGVSAAEQIRLMKNL